MAGTDDRAIVGPSQTSGAADRGAGWRRRGDGLWTLTSLTVFDMLVGTCGWSLDHYERWLADRLIEMLLA